MRFANFAGAAEQVLRDEQPDLLPADMIAEIALDRGWYPSQEMSRKGQIQSREAQIQSLASTMHSIVTRHQRDKPLNEHIFYRKRGQHPETGRQGVYLYGLKEWKSNGPAPSNNGSVPQAAPVSRVTISLDGKNREKIELLVKSGKYPSETEAVLAVVGWGLEVITKELEEIKEALDKIKRIPL